MPESSSENTSSDDAERGMAWFKEYIGRLENQPTDLPLRCPCCKCRTLRERGGYEICRVCLWEDDGQDDFDAEDVRGGPNGSLSLVQARSNYHQFGACEERFKDSVRKALPEELPIQ